MFFIDLFLWDAGVFIYQDDLSTHILHKQSIRGSHHYFILNVSLALAILRQTIFAAGLDDALLLLKKSLSSRISVSGSQQTMRTVYRMSHLDFMILGMLTGSISDAALFH
jgi:hypothetical protein